jgi:hypothetical protein
MKSTLSTIKNELQHLDKKELAELCLRLAKYKKENKELLSYLLFEAHNDEDYIVGIKSEMDVLFAEMNTSSVYLIKKTVRKILRFTNRYIKYASKPNVEMDLRLYFCQKMREEELPMAQSVTLANVYDREVERVLKAYDKLHEDMQYDYEEAIKNLA